MHEFSLTLLDPAKVPHSFQASIENAPGRHMRLTLSGWQGQDWSFDGVDPIDCLRFLRREVEPLGWRVLCQGSRRDTWASGMARDMGGGWRLYGLQRGRPANPNHLVEIFD